jgi:16S rRNA processing protein RimM
MTGSDRLVTLGRISGLFGVRGWVKVYSDTRPRTGILEYTPWLLQRHGVWVEFPVAAGKPHGDGIIARLQGIADRDAAAALVGCPIAVRRDQLPQTTAAGEYYWTDLEGLRVVTEQGIELGRVAYLFETGANDVMVVQGERERLIPYVWEEVVRKVDLEQGVIRVDWDPDF